MNSKAGMLALVAVLLGISALAVKAPLASANSGLTVTDDTIGIGDSTTAELCAGDTALDVTFVGLFDPTDTLVATSAILPSIAANTCASWSVPGDFDPAVVLTAGSWFVAVDTAQGGPIFTDFEVTFFVLPESPVGVVAILGSSLAALGAFAGIRKFRSV
jgi:hypothetical protein